jgi:hypothetical protein
MIERLGIAVLVALWNRTMADDGIAMDGCRRSSSAASSTTCA